jgi:excisionase family DNA binding protein
LLKKEFLFSVMYGVITIKLYFIKIAEKAYINRCWAGLFFTYSGGLAALWKKNVTHKKKIRVSKREELVSMETYLTIEELAEYLKLAEQTIRRWVLNREIPYRKIKKVIRFRVSEVEKWIDNGGINNVSSDSGVIYCGLCKEKNGEVVDGVEDEQDMEIAENGGGA